MQAMILAAGFGTRLKPYTLKKPKPLFPLLNIPLLILTVRRLQHAGCDHIVVNSHHLGVQIRTALLDIPGVVLQEEEKILGTGGGLRRAYERLRDEPLLVTNADIYHTVDFKGFYEQHLRSQAVVSLAVHDFPRFNSLLVEEDRVISFTGRGQAGALAFTGIHVLDPGILVNIAEGCQSCIIERYRDMLIHNEEILGIRVDDAYWTDIGTPRDYLELHGKLLQEKVPCWQEINFPKSGGHYIAENADIGGDFLANDWVCIGNAKIGDKVTLTRCVVWDGAIVQDGSNFSDRIITPWNSD